MKTLLILLVVILSACAAPFPEAENIPEDGWGLRCTDYTAQVNGMFMAGSGQGTGRQIIGYGPVPEAVTVPSESCKIEVNRRE